MPWQPFSSGSPLRHCRWLVLLPIIVLVPIRAAAEDWPQWRGSGGLGFALDAEDLPESWGPETDNIRWHTRVPGEGISSPIVSNGRVFVTTAYDGRSGLMKILLPATVLSLALVFAWLATGRCRRALNSVADLGASARKTVRKAARLLLGTSLLFALLACLIAVRPELFLEAGKPGRAWRIGSALALLGLAAALGWLRPASKWRLAAAAVLLIVSPLLLYYTPSGPLGRWPLKDLLPFVAPGLAASAWGIVSFVRARRRAPGPAVGLYDPRLALPLVVLAALVFVPPNFLDGLQRAVVSLDLASGELLWERVVFQAPPEQKWPRNTYATPTPAADGERVFAYFGAGLAALDFEGGIEWIKKFPDYTRFTRYGAGSSPVLTENCVIVAQESESFQDGPPSWYAAFEKTSGLERWRVESSDRHDTYGTPLVVADESPAQLVMSSWETLLALDAGSGERLWSHPTPMQQVIASPARSGNLLAITGGEVGDRALMLWRLPDTDSNGTPKLLWRTNKGVAVIVSPVIYQGIVFNLTTEGILTSYDAETGNQLWKKRLEGEYFASLVAGDGKVYATNTEGVTSVIAAAPEYNLKAVNKLADGVYTSAAIADGGILFRSASELIFIEGEAL
jgi:outer membrane protein assembly factor BamB